MPGVDLNLDLPSLSDTMADAIAKIATALSAIEDDLAGYVLPSEIDVNATFSLSGNAITNAASITLMTGNAPSTAGSIYYEDGEFYAIDAAGVVQLTANGSVNITGTGGFVGDYGQLGVDAAASYDNGNQEFTFTAEPGVYADLVADDLILNSATGSVRFGVDDAITTARQFILKDLPASGVSALVYDASTSTVESAENTRVTNDILATDIDLTGKVKHGNYTESIPFTKKLAYDSGDLVFGSQYGISVAAAGGAKTIYYPVLGFDRTKTIKGFTVVNTVATVSNVVYTLMYVNVAGVLTTTGITITTNGTSPSATGSFAVDGTSLGLFLKIVVPAEDWSAGTLNILYCSE